MNFRKKPVVIQAFQMTEARRIDNIEWPEWLNRAWNKSREVEGSVYPTVEGTGDGTLSCGTLEGKQLISWCDWIIQGVKGEIYPCKDDIFRLTYEPVTEGPVAANPDTPQSYGEKAVGLTFNPSGDTSVYRVKSLYANVIDEMDQLRKTAVYTGTRPAEAARLASIAITEAQGAQMWAVKALTWKD